MISENLYKEEQIKTKAWLSLWQFLSARRISATASAGLAPHTHRFGLLAPLSPQNLGAVARSQLNCVIASQCPQSNFLSGRLTALLSVLLELSSDGDMDVHSHQPITIHDLVAFVQRDAAPQELFQSLLDSCLQGWYFKMYCKLT